MSKSEDKSSTSRLETVSEFFQKTKRYGSLQDAYFHFCQKDEILARECVLQWFPGARAKLEIAKLTVHSKEFYGEDLRKSIADLIYLVHFLDGSGVLPLTLILEHKAQSSKLENASTLAQTLEYVASYCREQVKLRRDGNLEGPILQPIPIVIYTGADVNLRSLTWEDSFRLPNEFADYRIKFPLRFFYFFSLCQAKKFEASPFLYTAYNLMATASLGQLESVRKTALAPLSAVTEWGPREYDLLQASAYFYLKSAVNAGMKVDHATVEDLFASANQGEGEAMKSVWAEIGEEIAKNERERIREEGIGIGVEKGIGIGVEKGIGIGVEKGIGIGRLETLKENAASMRAEGWSDETIAKILRVDVADVKIWLDSSAGE